MCLQLPLVVAIMCSAPLSFCTLGLMCLSCDSLCSQLGVAPAPCCASAVAPQLRYWLYSAQVPPAATRQQVAPQLAELVVQSADAPATTRCAVSLVCL
ncbi:hypothetical protein CYMTET_53820 [Cymbomonas tetramitiformis]|uniref:Secreted protein n=1 Tax=Cymbomonas tetramitiformis TaxID=36881 RepID=A0AAE0EPP1_9CHLO|nr:hypothetical protein CYMTET_53820 [Cymbomonas tetramitiformis]